MSKNRVQQANEPVEKDNGVPNQETGEFEVEQRLVDLEKFVAIRHLRYVLSSILEPCSVGTGTMASNTAMVDSHYQSGLCQTTRNRGKAV